MAFLCHALTQRLRVIQQMRAAFEEAECGGRGIQLEMIRGQGQMKLDFYASCVLGLYCNASARCAVVMFSLPARSAIVRASLSTR